MLRCLFSGLGNTLFCFKFLLCLCKAAGVDFMGWMKIKSDLLGSEIAQRAKMLDAKPDNPSSASRSHVMEGVN